MKHLTLNRFTVLFLAFTLYGCGGGSSNSDSAASNTNCSQAPALGQATFGSGCFK